MIPKRIVLDTNVCLDLFVFGDPRWRRLHAALAAGELEAVTSGACRTEWLLVLDYPHLPLTPALRAQAIQSFDTLIACLPAAHASAPAAALPRCKDGDDQKFLETAHHSGAALLLTKDKALLKLAGKARRAGLFAIMTPDEWTRRQDPAASSRESAAAAEGAART